MLDITSIYDIFNTLAVTASIMSERIVKEDAKNALKVSRELSPPPIPDTVQEWAIPIAKLYEKTKERYNVSFRTLQWYSTEGLIPKPFHVRKEAFYDSRTIFDYIEVICFLNQTSDVLLSKVRDIIKKVEKLKVINNRAAISQLATLVRNFIYYRDTEFEKYQTIEHYADGPSITTPQSVNDRIFGVQATILVRLEGGSDSDITQLISSTILDLEKEYTLKNKDKKF